MPDQDIPGCSWSAHCDKTVRTCPRSCFSTLSKVGLGWWSVVMQAKKSCTNFRAARKMCAVTSEKAPGRSVLTSGLAGKASVFWNNRTTGVQDRSQAAAKVAAARQRHRSIVSFVRRMVRLFARLRIFEGLPAKRKPFAQLATLH